jgi:GTP-binding protein
MRVLAQFLASATGADHFPAPTVPEVAFLGRSNVGKSSVINTLVGAKIARTSSTPGRTRSINFFEVRFPGKPRPDVIFADLPGYGYAKLSREISAEWPKFIEPYLNDRPTLALCIALIDVNVPPQDSDRHLLDFLNSSGRDFLLIATKSDRLSNNQLHNALKKLTHQTDTSPDTPERRVPSTALFSLSFQLETSDKSVRHACQQRGSLEVDADSFPENLTADPRTHCYGRRNRRGRSLLGRLATIRNTHKCRCRAGASTPSPHP